jgi:hypothetical protein
MIYPFHKPDLIKNVLGVISLMTGKIIPILAKATEWDNEF